MLKLAPAWATVGLLKFGTNPYGVLQFRVSWLPSVTRIIGGYWDDNGKSEYRRVPKYGLDAKWGLERWRPPSIYGTPALWDSQTSTPDGFFAIGPFPAHGEFELCERFSTQYGPAGYVPLEPGLIELTARAVWMGRINTYSDLRRIHEDEELAKERAQDQKFDELWRERQTVHSGLTMGYGKGFVNKDAEIEEYERRIQKAQAYATAFRPGFRQY